MVPVKSVGSLSFEMTPEAPNYLKIPSIDDLLGVSALLVCAFYRGKEFFRCSYFVHNSYAEEIHEDFTKENFDINKVFRTIYAEKPRVTLMEVDWNDELSQLYGELIRLDQTDDLDMLRSANNKMFSELENPFQLNENSFLGSNMYVQQPKK